MGAFTKMRMPHSNQTDFIIHFRNLTQRSVACPFGKLEKAFLASGKIKYILFAKSIIRVNCFYYRIAVFNCYYVQSEMRTQIDIKHGLANGFIRY